MKNDSERNGISTSISNVEANSNNMIHIHKIFYV